MKTISIIIALVAACASPSEPKQQPNTTTSDTEQNSASEKISGDNTAEIRALLLARHIRDLPSKTTLDRYAEPANALRTIAATDEKLVVRARALELLRHYPDARTESQLLATFGNPSIHAKLRAAAIRGLVGFDLEARSDLRDAVAPHLADADPSVGVAAVYALSLAPSARPMLQKAASSQNVTEQARQAAAKY